MRAGAKSAPISAVLTAQSPGGWAIGGPSASIATARAARSPRTLAGRDRSYQTCANAAAVCRAFEISRRRETLSFSHHETVAALAPAEQDRLLGEADRQGWSRQELRAAVHSTKRPVVRSLKSPTRSVTVAMTKSADRITVPWIAARLSDAASSPITYLPPPVHWVTPPPSIADQPPRTNPDPTTNCARAAERELAHFLEQFANSYGAIQGFAPVIERLREAQMMLSEIVFRKPIEFKVVIAAA
jgi:hypothetical protein